MRRLFVPLIACLVGCLTLAVYVPRFWQPAPRIKLSRGEIVQRARAVTSRFGLDTGGWRVYMIRNDSWNLDDYQRAQPEDTLARELSPVVLRVLFLAPEGAQVAKVSLDSLGKPLAWEGPSEAHLPARFSTDREAAQDAFRYFAGDRASAYSLTTDASSGRQGKRFLWDRSVAEHTVLKRISVETKGHAVISAEMDPLAPDLASPPRSDENFWAILKGSFAILCFAVLIAAVAIFTMWSVRRSINHQFSLRIAGVTAVAFAAVSVFGSDKDALWYGYHSSGNIVLNQQVLVLFLTVVVVCVAALGRSVSADARPKWWTLEQFVFLAPWSKQMGSSIISGVLLGPAICAIPFAIAALTLTTGISVNNREHVVYSPAPLLDSIVINGVLMGFFGVLMPLLNQRVRNPKLCFAITAALGTLIFATYTTAVTEHPSAALACGFLAFGSYYYLYRAFDILTVLVAESSCAFVWTANVLLHGSQAMRNQAWEFIAALGVVLAAGLLLLFRGSRESQGDPRATTPGISTYDAERDRLLADFAVARRAQEEMLPQVAPAIPGYAIAASCTPSLEVGGDLYDFLFLPDGRLGICVADVSGKGVPAALYMTLTKGVLNSVVCDHVDLGRVLTQVNHHVHTAARKKVFVTMALGFLDPGSGTLQYARAGHNPVVLRSASKGTTQLLSPPGMGLGITGGKLFETFLKIQELQLQPGDTVVFYSDGLTEAMNRKLEQFGEARLMASVEKTDRLGATAARDSILGDVREFLGGVHPQDDMTVVVLRMDSA